MAGSFLVKGGCMLKRRIHTNPGCDVWGAEEGMWRINEGLICYIDFSPLPCCFPWHQTGPWVWTKHNCCLVHKLQQIKCFLLISAKGKTPWSINYKNKLMATLPAFSMISVSFSPPLCLLCLSVNKFPPEAAYILLHDIWRKKVFREVSKWKWSM